MYQINYARAYLKRSTDEGLTWSSPQEITAVFEEFRSRDDYDWEVIAMGPGHGITLKTGRLVVPVWLSTSRKHRPSIASTIYSDDHGATWHAGEVIVDTSEEIPNPSEHMLVELADGAVMSNIRTESSAHRRLTSVSSDGATGWSKPQFVDDLYEPVCMAGLVSVLQESNDGEQLLLFSNPNSGPQAQGYMPEWGDRTRRNLTLRISRDSGASWDDGLVIEAGPSAYSDLAISPDGFVYVLYETGAGTKHGAFDPQGIVFARIPLETLLTPSLTN
jgi:sialidase-1